MFVFCAIPRLEKHLRDSARINLNQLDDGNHHHPTLEVMGEKLLYECVGYNLPACGGPPSPWLDLIDRLYLLEYSMDGGFSNYISVYPPTVVSILHDSAMVAMIARVLEVSLSMYPGKGY